MTQPAEARNQAADPTAAGPAGLDAALAAADLSAVVRWFDLAATAEFDQAMTAQPANDEQDGIGPLFTCPATVTLTRAVAIAGRLLAVHEGFPEDHPVRRTLDAADAYLTDPGDETYDRYQIAATNSYPYGAGDGCHAVEPSDPAAAPCAPGSGCRSGSGTLAAIAYSIGDAAVLDAVRRATT